MVCFLYTLDVLYTRGVMRRMRASKGLYLALTVKYPHQYLHEARCTRSSEPWLESSSTIIRNDQEVYTAVAPVGAVAAVVDEAGSFAGLRASRAFVGDPESGFRNVRDNAWRRETGEQKRRPEIVR